MVVALVIAVIALVVVAALVLARKGAAGANARIAAAMAELEVLRSDKASFYGLASGGSSQVRGLGTLVATPDELVFFQMVPATEVRVARSAVRFAEIGRNFLGKGQGRDLLLVTWITEPAEEGGEPGEDRAAWDVPDPDGWRSLLWPG